MLGDLLYLAGTIGFFGLMFLYVQACNALGGERRDGAERGRP